MGPCRHPLHPGIQVIGAEPGFIAGLEVELPGGMFLFKSQDRLGAAGGQAKAKAKCQG